MNEYTALLLIPLLNLKKSTGICTATRIYYRSVKIKNFAMVSIEKSRNSNKKPNILIANTVFWNQEFQNNGYFPPIIYNIWHVCSNHQVFKKIVFWLLLPVPMAKLRFTNMALQKPYYVCKTILNDKIIE